MADKFRLNVLTPERSVFEGVVATLQASGRVGDFGVLPGHYAYITSIRPGGLSFEADGKAHRYVVGHGFAQVSADRVSLVVSSCEEATEVDVAAARTVLAEAEKVLLDGQPSDPGYADAQVDMEMALGRIQAAAQPGGE